MPGGDRTGPIGAGPMTGRGAGYCTGSPTPGFMNRGFGGGGGFGRGFGRGGARGWRNQYYATGLTGWQRAGIGRPGFAGGSHPMAAQNADVEIESLQQQAAVLGDQLEAIKERIDQLSTKKSSKE